MNHQSPETANHSHPTSAIFRVYYAIQDGEFEYGDCFFLKSDWYSIDKEAHRKLAELFDCDEEDEKKMLEALQSKGKVKIDCRIIKDLSFHVVDSVTIILRDGQIQDIQNIPDDRVIRVKDYDVDGVPDEKKKQDENGDSYVESVWE